MLEYFRRKRQNKDQSLYLVQLFYYWQPIFLCFLIDQSLLLQSFFPFSFSDGDGRKEIIAVQEWLCQHTSMYLQRIWGMKQITPTTKLLTHTKTFNVLFKFCHVNWDACECSILHGRCTILYPWYKLFQIVHKLQFLINTNSWPIWLKIR